jgi:hypothetical protein
VGFRWILWDHTPAGCSARRFEPKEYSSNPILGVVEMVSFESRRTRASSACTVKTASLRYTIVERELPFGIVDGVTAEL